VRATLDDYDGHRSFTWSNWLTVTTTNVKINENEIIGSLLNLINAGSASGKVITQQVFPAPAGFQTLYQITVYGLGLSPSASGLYVYVTSSGVPGVIIDADDFAIGPFSSVPGDVATKAQVFPFKIEGGTVKIKRCNVEILQADQIDAGAITADKIQVGTITADKIKGAEISELIGGGSNIDAKVKVQKKGGIILVGNFDYEVDDHDSMKVAIVRQDGGTVKNSTWSLKPNAKIKGTATVMGAISKDASGEQTYELKKTSGKGTFENAQLFAFRVLH
jgi:hypothetical protein